MKPFDPDARCPECAYDAVGTRYEHEVSYPPDYPIEYLERGPLPHPAWLVRTCARCLYSWLERPVDEPPDHPPTG